LIAGVRITTQCMARVAAKVIRIIFSCARWVNIAISTIVTRHKITHCITLKRGRVWLYEVIMADSFAKFIAAVGMTIFGYHATYTAGDIALEQVASHPTRAVRKFMAEPAAVLWLLACAVLGHICTVAKIMVALKALTMLSSQVMTKARAVRVWLVNAR